MLDLSKNIMYEFWYNYFFYIHIYTFKQKKYNHQVHKYQCTWDPSKIMFISLGNLGKPFLTWKTYIYKQTIPKIMFKS